MVFLGISVSESKIVTFLVLLFLINSQTEAVERHHYLRQTMKNNYSKRFS